MSGQNSSMVTTHNKGHIERCEGYKIYEPIWIFSNEYTTTVLILLSKSGKSIGYEGSVQTHIDHQKKTLQRVQEKKGIHIEYIYVVEDKNAGQRSRHKFETKESRYRSSRLAFGFSLSVGSNTRIASKGESNSLRFYHVTLFNRIIALAGRHQEGQ